MNTPQPPATGTTDELAKRRNRDAAERTLTAWIQNSLTLMGLGIALDRISMALHKTFPSINLMISRQVAKELGLSLIAFSISLLMLAMWQYQIGVRSIDRDNYLFLSSRSLISIATTTVILFGIIAAMIIVFKSL